MKSALLALCVGALVALNRAEPPSNVGLGDLSSGYGAPDSGYGAPISTGSDFEVIATPAAKGVKYAGPIVYTNEKPPIIHFPPPPKPKKGGGGWKGKASKAHSIKYVPLPHHDLPILIYQSDIKPPIHVVHPPAGSDFGSDAGHQAYGVPKSADYAPPAADFSSQPKGEYGAPAAEYGAPSAAYGAPSGAYGAPSAPSNAYGAPSAPSNAYGAPSAPSSAYGAPSSPSNAYGAPSAPSSAYGAPVSSSYGVPSAPASTAYGAPSASISGGYGAPAAPVSNYGPPAAEYGPPKAAPVVTYGPPASEYGPPKAQPLPHIIYTGHPPIHIFQQPPIYMSAPSNKGSHGPPPSHKGKGKGNNFGFSFHIGKGAGKGGKGDDGYKPGPPPKGWEPKGWESSSSSGWEKPKGWESKGKGWEKPKGWESKGKGWEKPKGWESKGNGWEKPKGWDSKGSLHDNIKAAVHNLKAHIHSHLPKASFSISFTPNKESGNGWSAPAKAAPSKGWGAPKGKFLNLGSSKSSSYALAPKGFNKPPIIIYQGPKPPVHVYETPNGGYSESSVIAAPSAIIGQPIGEYSHNHNHVAGTDAPGNPTAGNVDLTYGVARVSSDAVRYLDQGQQHAAKWYPGARQPSSISDLISGGSEFYRRSDLDQAILSNVQLLTNNFEQQQHQAFQPRTGSIASSSSSSSASSSDSNVVVLDASPIPQTPVVVEAGAISANGEPSSIVEAGSVVIAGAPGVIAVGSAVSGGDSSNIKPKSIRITN